MNVGIIIVTGSEKTDHLLLFLTLCAKRRRITVLVLCVCLSVYLCICYHSRGGIVNLYTRTKVLTALSRYTLHFQLVDFDKNASFRSYGVVCYSAGAI